MHNQTENRTYWLKFYIPPRASGVFWLPLTKTSLALGARLQWPMFLNTTGYQYYKTCQKSTFAIYFPQTTSKQKAIKTREEFLERTFQNQNFPAMILSP